MAKGQEVQTLLCKPVLIAVEILIHLHAKHLSLKGCVDSFHQREQ